MTFQSSNHPVFHILKWRFPKMGGTPKSSILMGFSLINHPFGGIPILWKTPTFWTGFIKVFQAVRPVSTRLCRLVKTPLEIFGASRLPEAAICLPRPDDQRYIHQFRISTKFGVYIWGRYIYIYNYYIYIYILANMLPLIDFGVTLSTQPGKPCFLLPEW